MIRRFNHFPTIETQRLTLREMSEVDVDELFSMRSDAQVNRYLKGYSHSTKLETLAWVRKTMVALANGELVFWLIESKNKHQFMGSICLLDLSHNTNSAEIGYTLMPDFHHQGYMDEALKSILSFGIEEMHLSFINAFTRRDNKSSIALLNRNGFHCDVEITVVAEPDKLYFRKNC